MSNSNEKDKLVQEYKQSIEEVQNLLKKTNTFDAIRILLSFYECLDNELTHGYRNMEIKKQYNNLPSAALIESSVTLSIVILELLIPILLYTNMEKSELTHTPSIISIFATNPEGEDTQNWLLRNYDPSNDGMISTGMKLLEGSLKAKRFTIFKNFFNFDGQEQITNTFNLLFAYARFRSLLSILKENIPARISEENKIEFKNPNPFRVLEEKEMLPRDLASPDHYFWRDEVISTRKRGLLTTYLNSTTPTQFESRNKEHLAFFSELQKVPNFEKIFAEKTGMSLQSFCYITLALQEIALSTETSVAFIPKTRLIIKAGKISNCSKKDIEKFLNMFMLKEGDVIQGKYIFFDGINCLFSWSMISIPSEVLPMKIYKEFVDGNYRGVDFENECRKIIRNLVDFVFDDRFYIKRRIISDDLSIKLWGHIKENTELDIICAKENSLFIIECKSERKRTQSRETSQLNAFQKYYDELIAKSQWISENYEEFRNIANSQNCQIPENIRFVLPLLVTSFKIQNKENLLTISPDELKEILIKFSKKDESLQTEVTLDSKIQIKIPCFKIIQ